MDGGGTKAMMPHDYVVLYVFGSVAGIKDTISQCARCGLTRHDYEYDGGKTLPNYPDFYRNGQRVADVGCTRGDMTEERATEDAWRELVDNNEAQCPACKQTILNMRDLEWDTAGAEEIEEVCPHCEAPIRITCHATLSYTVRMAGEDGGRE